MMQKIQQSKEWHKIP